MAFGRIHMFCAEASETRYAFALICGSGGTQTGLCDKYVATALVQRRPSCQRAGQSLAHALGRTRSGESASGGSHDPTRSEGDTAARKRRVQPRPSIVRARGYTVGIEEIPLDAGSPATMGVSPYVALRLAANCRLQDPMSHLYVLIPRSTCASTFTSTPTRSKS
jgi:RNA repair, ligase-Pnkp-associating, region of Hen1